MLNVIIFLSYTTILAVLLIIAAPTPVHSILFGLLFYISLGGILVFAGYDFVGVAFVIIYAGALMVMFLFVIMAFDLTRSNLLYSASSGAIDERWFRVVVLLLLSGFGARTVRYAYVVLLEGSLNSSPYPVGSTNSYDVYVTSETSLYFGTSLLEDISIVFYQGYLVPILLCGVLLLVGLIGAVALTETCRPRRSPRRLSPVVLRSVSRRVINLRRLG